MGTNLAKFLKYKLLKKKVVIPSYDLSGYHRHSAENRKWWIEEKTVLAPIVEPTCAAFGTNKKQPRTSKEGKIENKKGIVFFARGQICPDFFC